MKYRTINEAKNIQLQNIPQIIQDEYSELIKRLLTENASSSSKLKKIFSLTDKIAALVTPYAVCEKGCSYCCNNQVVVTPIEAEYIEKNCGIVKDSGSNNSLGTVWVQRPCSLLDSNGACSVYAHRPFPCRVYLAFDDPKYCADGKTKHVTYSVNSSNLLKSLYDLVLRLNKSKPSRDIRDFFKYY